MAKPTPDTMDGVNPATADRPMAGDGMTHPEGGKIAPPAARNVGDDARATDKDKLPPPPEGDLSM
jgi:hypothetical protein